MIDAITDRIESGNDRAVSPVIGVILMVAITVILAAVIGTFVLDLGQSAGNNAPQASLSVTANTNGDPDSDGADGSLTIEHDGGDSLDSAATRIQIEHSGNTLTWDEEGTSSVLNVGGSFTFDFTGDNIAGDFNHGAADSGSTGALSQGDQVTVTLIDVDSQRVIFETTVTA